MIGKDYKIFFLSADSINFCQKKILSQGIISAQLPWENRYLIPPKCLMGVLDIPSYQELKKQIEFLRKDFSSIKIVVVSNKYSKTQLQEMHDFGVVYWTEKPLSFKDSLFLASLFYQEIRQLKLIEENGELKHLVEIDDLTGLYNMRFMNKRIEYEQRRSQRYNRPLACVMFDIDDFKKVNDFNDHLFGSFVLKEIGKIILKSTRIPDLPARFGGDEFVIILVETDSLGALEFTKRLRKTIESYIFCREKQKCRLTISVGLVMLSKEIETPEKFIQCADKALYMAKKEGKNRIFQYSFSHPNSVIPI